MRRPARCRIWKTNPSRTPVVLLEKLNKEYNLELTVEAPEELKQFSEEVTEGYVIKTEPAQGEILKRAIP